MLPNFSRRLTHWHLFHRNKLYFCSTVVDDAELVDRHRCVLYTCSCKPHAAGNTEFDGDRYYILLRSSTRHFCFAKLFVLELCHTQIVHVNHSKRDIVKFNHGWRRDRDYSVNILKKKSNIYKKLNIFKKSNIIK